MSPGWIEKLSYSRDRSKTPERVALLERERERRGRIDHVPRYALAQERVQPVRIPRGWVHLVIKDGPAGSAQLPVALDADHAFGVRRKPEMEDELAQIDALEDRADKPRQVEIGCFERSSASTDVRRLVAMPPPANPARGYRVLCGSYSRTELTGKIRRRAEVRCHENRGASSGRPCGNRG